VPKYFYQCGQCTGSFEVVHSIKERMQDCHECASSGSLERLPYAPIAFKTHDKDTRAGELVNRFIKEGKVDVEQQKNEYKEEL
jgi:putative FmdB family regulatory protein